MKNGKHIGCWVVLALFGVACVMLLRQFTGTLSGSDTAVTQIETKSWVQLSQGMTKSQVSNLLGAPLAAVFHLPTPTNQSPRPRYILRYANYWQYNTADTAGWQLPWLLEPHRNAYLVHFDTNDLVESWQTPEDRANQFK